jgi:hypothetical protein
LQHALIHHVTFTKDLFEKSETHLTRFVWV